MISEIGDAIGAQSVVGVLDTKKSLFKGYEIFIENGKKIRGNLVNWIEKYQEFGVGEILLNSIDCDGMQHGYDLRLASLAHSHIKCPSLFWVVRVH